MRDDQRVDGSRGSDASAPSGTPVLTVDDDVLADLLLVSDGLADGSSLVPGGPARAAGEHGSRSARVSLLLAPGDQDLAVAAGAVEVADAEGFPVVRLDDLAARGETLVGTVTPTGRVSTGHGHHLRPAAPLPPPAGERDVVVLSRPLLAADEDLLRSRTQAGVEVVLVLPLAGPSPDGLPVPVLLRAAERAAARTRALLVGATLRWRDPTSDGHLVEQLRHALGGTRLVEALPDDERWVALLVDHRADRTAGPDAAEVETQVRADLAAWWPPPARRGVVVLLSGLCGSGKSTLARALATHLTSGPCARSAARRRRRPPAAVVRPRLRPRRPRAERAADRLRGRRGRPARRRRRLRPDRAVRQHPAGSAPDGAGRAATSCWCTSPRRWRSASAATSRGCTPAPAPARSPSSPASATRTRSRSTPTSSSTPPS